MKETLYNFLSACNDSFWWSLKFTKDTVLWSLTTSKNSVYWFAKISSNGVVYGAKMILHMLTYSNDLFFYYMKYLWRNASKETLYYVCLWFKDNWRYITSPEVRGYVIQGLKDWVIRERNGFINALDGPYGIHTFMMFAFLCLMIGMTIQSILNPDFFTVKEEEIDLFARFSMDPDVLIAQERALEAQQERELEHRMFHDPDFNPLEHPRLRREYIQERLAILRAREFAKSPLSDLYQP